MTRLQRWAMGILEYVFTGCLILFGNTAWLQSTNYAGMASVVRLALVAAILLSLLVKRWLSIPSLLKSIYRIAAIWAYLGLFLLFNPLNAKQLLMVMLMLALLVLYYDVYLGDRSLYPILYKHSRLMAGLALLSLFFWVFGSLLGSLPANVSLVTKWIGGNDKDTVFYGYYHLHYNIQTISGMVRNSGIFIESPMFAFQLVLALATEVFFAPKPSRLVRAVLCLAIVTSFSITGMILMGAILFARLYFQKSSRQLSALKFFVLPLLVFAGIYLVQSLLSVHSSLGTSNLIRADDFKVGLRAWLSRPLLGHGFGNTAVLKSQMGLWRQYNTGFSNSPTLILAQGGIYLFALYLLAAARGLFIAIRTKDSDRLFFDLTVIFLFIFTILPYNYLTILLLLFLADKTASREAAAPELPLQPA